LIVCYCHSEIHHGCAKIKEEQSSDTLTLTLGGMWPNSQY